MNNTKVTVRGPAGAADLDLPWETTVGQLLEAARAGLELPAEADLELWCGDGTTMMNKLERTLEALQERRICPKREFELRSSGRDRVD